jgi:hypothetical protein
MARPYGGLLAGAAQECRYTLLAAHQRTMTYGVDAASVHADALMSDE